MIKYVLLIFLIFSLNSCNEKRIVQTNPELFIGQLEFFRVDEVFHRTDNIELTINGSSYTLNHTTNESKLCSSHGSQSGFGTNKMILSPDALSGNNCDNFRIPRGEFNAIFRNDSLILGPRIDTLFIEVGENDTRREIWSYHLKLR